MLVGGPVLFRQALVFMLERERGLETIAQAATLSAARRLLTRDVDVAVVDLSLPDGNGTDLVGELREANPESVVLVLTEDPDPGESLRAMEAGADEVLDKSVPVARIIGAVKRLVHR